MSNTLTALAPTLFSVAQEVSSEPFGVISAINANFADKGVAIGDKVLVPVAPTRSAADYTPAMTSSAGTDAIASAIEVQITKNRHVSWNLTGEQIASLRNGGNYEEWARQLIAQGLRTLRNEAEADACLAAKIGASRAVGTAGTNPFATNIDPIADVRKILQDNGAPLSDLQLCIDSSAGTAARKLGIIQQAYQAGSEEERRSGRLLRQFGFQIVESAGITLHTKGTGTSYQSNNAAAATLATGTTGISVDTGSGTVLAGDVVTFTGDTNKYVINTALSGGALAIGRPGLRATLADDVAMAVGNNYTPNLAFERNAIVGVMRPPRIPDSPLIRQLMVSDKNGLTYCFCEVVGDGMLTWRLHLAWGFKVVQSEHVALLLG
jgi:hypothetical protein